MKTVVVTGGVRGIGRAICKALSSDGWRVAVNYKESRVAAEALASDIGGMAIRADVSIPDEVKRMFDIIGSAGAVICNAAAASYGVFQDVSNEWKRIFDVNIGGVINTVKYALPPMISSKSGVIITIGSVWGTLGASCESIYAASKSAVIGLTKSLALELAPSGIRVNCVSPGIIADGMTTEKFPDAAESLAKNVPLGRLGSAEDIANLTAYLCSDKAKYITGQVFSIDGGMS